MLNSDLTFVKHWYGGSGTLVPDVTGTTPAVQEADGQATSSRFAALDAAVRDGIGSLYPGAVLMAAHRGRLVHAAAFGHAQTLTTGSDDAPRPLACPHPMRLDTIFDLASLTKVAATTVAVMRLVDAGRIALDETLGVLLPGFAKGDKAPITVRHLLTHRAGLWEWQPAWLHRDTEGGVPSYLAALPRRYPIGERYAYSDLGFMLLGEIVARGAGMSLDRYVREWLYAPLGMPDTGFRPAATHPTRYAATSLGDLHQRRMAETGLPFPPGPIPPPIDTKTRYRRHVLVGEANDVNVALGWDGIAGHAGLFGSAADLLRLTGALIDPDPRIASPATLARFAERPYDADQALGFRAYAVAGVDEPFLGHTGFTGTFLAYSRTLSASVVLLTNRVHRDDRDGTAPPVLADLQEFVLRSVAEIVARADVGDDGVAAG